SAPCVFKLSDLAPKAAALLVAVLLSNGISEPQIPLQRLIFSPLSVSVGRQPRLNPFETKTKKTPKGT
ncbi:MAG: hypothetical protein QNL54_15220, partial [Rhodobacterales bacterium]